MLHIIVLVEYIPLFEDQESIFYKKKYILISGDAGSICIVKSRKYE